MDNIILEYKKNIEKVYLQSNEREKIEGKRWYINAHNFARRVSRQCEFSHKQIVYALAALSPLTPWEKNKENLINFVGYVSLGYTWKNIPISTFPNRKKAYDILVKNDPTILSGKKVECFADNIHKPKTSKLVTIDTWQAKIAFGISEIAYKIPALTNKRYQDISLSHILLADELNYRPLELQAITWITYHRLLNSRSKNIS